MSDQFGIPSNHSLSARSRMPVSRPEETYKSQPFDGSEQAAKKTATVHTEKQVPHSQSAQRPSVSARNHQFYKDESHLSYSKRRGLEDYQVNAVVSSPSDLLYRLNTKA